MLEVQNLIVGYGKAQIIDCVSFQVDPKEGLALLGRNGAGKSTILKAVMGLLKPWSGDIRLNGQSIGDLPSDGIARLGIGYVPEERRIFADLSVVENLVTGAKPSPTGEIFWTQSRIFELFPEIARRRHADAGSLSGGERQMLAIARALVGNPCFLLLDEPSEGLAPVVVQKLGTVLSALRQENVGLLVAEQNQKLASRLVDHALILETGINRHTSSFNELRTQPQVVENYLGVQLNN